ncbi:MAG TPA: tetratricopeptide repeat protein [Blastocatellia bacterium]|nr:tetratricopeptide repeat protein [Blastocatellia bacterium]
MSVGTGGYESRVQKRVAAVGGTSAQENSVWLTNSRIIMLVGLLAVLVYSNSLGGEFVFDDTDQITQNQSIRSWGNVGHAFTTSVWSFRDQAEPGTPPPLPYYRPLFTVLLTVEYHLFGLWPQGWHLVSLALHVACSIGVFYLLLLLSGQRIVAGGAALLFAVHPVHAESVCWVSGLTDPLFSIFFIGSLCFYLRARESAATSKRSSESGINRTSMTWSLVLFVLAAYSKETALSLIVMVFGLELIKSAGSTSSRLSSAARAAIPYLLASLLYLIPRYLVLKEMMFRNPQAVDRPAIQSLLTLPFVICSYLLHLIWPVGLSVTYGTHFITRAGALAFLIPALVIAVTVASLIYWRARVPRYVWPGLLLVLVPLIPVLNLSQISREEYLVFDHYLYLPVAGFAFLLSSVLLGAKRLPASRITVAVLLLAAAIVVSVRGNMVWASSEALWSNAARVCPSYWAPQYNAGVSFLESGDVAGARERLESAAAMKPDEAVVFDALGRVYARLGDRPAATRSFKRALTLQPDLFEAHNNLGTVYFEAADYQTAANCFEQALRLKASAVASRYNLALCYLRLGKAERAAVELERVVASGSDAEACYELGIAYEQAGQAMRAGDAFRRGLELAGEGEVAERIKQALSRLHGK